MIRASVKGTTMLVRCNTSVETTMANRRTYNNSQDTLEPEDKVGVRRDNPGRDPKA